MPQTTFCPERLRSVADHNRGCLVDAPWWEWCEKWGLWKCVRCGKYNNQDNGHLKSRWHKDLLRKQAKLQAMYPDVDVGSLESEVSHWRDEPAAPEMAATASDGAASAAAPAAARVDPPAWGSTRSRSRHSRRGRSSSPRTWGGGAAAAAASPHAADTGNGPAPAILQHGWGNIASATGQAEPYLQARPVCPPKVPAAAACPGSLQRSDGNDPGGPAGAAAEPSRGPRRVSWHPDTGNPAEHGQGEHGQGTRTRAIQPADEEASENPDLSPDSTRNSYWNAPDFWQMRELLECVRELCENKEMLCSEVMHMRRVQEVMRNDLHEMKNNAQIVKGRLTAATSLLHNDPGWVFRRRR